MDAQYILYSGNVFKFTSIIKNNTIRHMLKIMDDTKKSNQYLYKLRVSNEEVQKDIGLDNQHFCLDREQELILPKISVVRCEILKVQS